MNKKVTSIVAYIGAIGWLIAFLAGDKEGAKFHMNQALILVVFNSAASILGIIPILGDIALVIVGVAILVFSIIGIIYAAQEQEKELPLIGGFKIIN